MNASTWFQQWLPKKMKIYKLAFLRWKWKLWAKKCRKWIQFLSVEDSFFCALVSRPKICSCFFLFIESKCLAHRKRKWRWSKIRLGFFLLFRSMKPEKMFWGERSLNVYLSITNRFLFIGKLSKLLSVSKLLAIHWKNMQTIKCKMFLIDMKKVTNKAILEWYVAK